MIAKRIQQKNHILVFNKTRRKFFSLLLTIPFSVCVQSGEWTGYADIEFWQYFNDPTFPYQQDDANTSLSSELEYYDSWDNGRQSLAVKPFFRVDQHDNERTHADFREFMWTLSLGSYDFGLGVGEVYWGKTEFYHPNNVINQTDFVEGPREKEKLGQPMARVSFLRDWGSAEVFVLPGFRERTFSGIDGRFRLVETLNTDNPQYESSREEHHIDWALNLSYSILGADIGLSHFDGTSREPGIVLNQQALPVIELLPYYQQIQQTGIYMQANVGNWLWKWEAAHREEKNDNSLASTGGFEYTFVGVATSRLDIGLVIEYMHDERSERALHYYQDDIGLGFRFALNDEQSTEALIGFVSDQDNDAQVWSVEMSRRLGNRWKLDVDALIFSHVEKNDVLSGIENDDYIRISIRRYF